MPYRTRGEGKDKGEEEIESKGYEKRGQVLGRNCDLGMMPHLFKISQIENILNYLIFYSVTGT